MQFFGLYENNDRLFLIMEYMAKSSLLRVLRTEDPPLEFKEQLRIARFCTAGLTYMHSQSIVHMDLSARYVKMRSDVIVCKRRIAHSRSLRRTAQKYSGGGEERQVACQVV